MLVGLKSSSNDQLPEANGVPEVFNVGNGRADEPNVNDPSEMVKVNAEALNCPLKSDPFLWMLCKLHSPLISIL
jgi:hypothetical protein